MVSWRNVGGSNACSYSEKVVLVTEISNNEKKVRSGKPRGFVHQKQLTERKRGE